MLIQPVKIKPTIAQAWHWVATLPNASTTLKDETEILLGFILKKERAWLISHNQHQLNLWQWIKFRHLVIRRQHGWPIAYLINEGWFYGRPFYINRQVLIPRPETEILIKQCLEIYNNLQNTDMFRHSPAEILTKEWRRRAKTLITTIDVGTGSGCIAITIAKECPNANIYATDISKQALRVAHRNAQRHKVEDKINFYHGDLLKAVPTKILSSATIIVANLPYLPADHHQSATPYEPKLALYGQNKEGLALISKLINQVKNCPHLIALILEIDPRQAATVKKIILNTLPSGHLKIINDLSNRPRAVIYTP